MRVIDFMAPRARTVEVFRVVTGIEGAVRMHTELCLRFDY